MGLDDFKIIFDNPWSTYYPGQTVTGRVVININSAKKIRGINCKIKGEANTCWATDRQEHNQEGRYENESQTVTGHEEYFSMHYYLLGSASASEMELPPGEHVYPFTFSLPNNLPSSFEHIYGHIRYTVKAILDRPWKFDQETKAAFSIVANLDLNCEGRAMEPLHQELSKTFCCLCCGSAPLRVNIIMPVRGYVPGQAMSIRVNVDNQSGVVIENVKLILRKIVTFKANNPRIASRREKIIISEVSKGPVEAGGISDYEQTLDIPPLPPSNLTNCNLIDLEYNLKVEAVAQGWWHLNLKGNNLVFIGTVPLVNYQSSIIQPDNKIDQQKNNDYHDKLADPTYGGYPSGYPAFTNTTDGSFPSVPPTAPPPPLDNNTGNPTTPTSHNIYPNMPPPSYEEAGWSVKSLRENNENSHVIGNNHQFAPRYPVYKFSS